MDYKNLFEEGSSRFEERYSTIIIVAFIYYVFGYYILEIQDRCKLLVEWKTLAGIVMFHIAQMTFAYRYWSDGQIMYAWGIVLVPLIIFVIAKQYMSSYKKKAYMNMKAYVQRKAALDDNTRLFNRDTTPTGIQTEQLRMEQGRPPATEILGVPPQQMAQLQMNQTRTSNNISAYGDYTQYDPDYQQQQLNQSIGGNNVFSSF